MRSELVSLRQVCGAMLLERYQHLFSRIRFMRDLCDAADDFGILEEEQFLDVCQEWDLDLEVAVEIGQLLANDGVFRFSPSRR